MGLVNLGIQDSSKQFWEQTVVKNRDRTEEMQIAPFQLLPLPPVPSG